MSEESNFKSVRRKTLQDDLDILTARVEMLEFYAYILMEEGAHEPSFMPRPLDKDEKTFLMDYHARLHHQFGEVEDDGPA